MKPGVFYAIVSGIFAALASVSGKVAAAAGEARWMCEAMLDVMARPLFDCDRVSNANICMIFGLFISFLYGRDLCE